MFKIYSIDHCGPEIHEIYKEKPMWSCNNWILKKQLLIFNFTGNIKIRALNFGYVMGVDCDHHVYKFSDESTGFIKSYGTTHLILFQKNLKLVV